MLYVHWLLSLQASSIWTLARLLQRCWVLSSGGTWSLGCDYWWPFPRSIRSLVLNKLTRMLLQSKFLCNFITSWYQRQSECLPSVSHRLRLGCFVLQQWHCLGRLRRSFLLEGWITGAGLSVYSSALLLAWSLVPDPTRCAQAPMATALKWAAPFQPPWEPSLSGWTSLPGSWTSFQLL